MRYLSKNELVDRLRFVESQTVFVLETTAKVNTANDFLMSQDGMVLFNSTCMCLQSIGDSRSKPPQNWLLVPLGFVRALQREVSYLP